jgi:predicted phage terminase large subunit-like protein
VIVRLPDGTLPAIAAIEVPPYVDEQLQSWDCAFKDLLTSDYVVGQAWARLANMFLLGDQVRARMDCPATVRAVRELSRKWPSTYTKLIEDKANGSAVIQMLSNELPGLLPVNPQGGKIARAAAVSPLVEAGNVYLPHPDYAPCSAGKPETALSRTDVTLFGKLVRALPGVALRRFDLLVSLATEDADETSHGVGLPTSNFHNLDQRRTLGALHHHDDFGLLVGAINFRFVGRLLGTVCFHCGLGHRGRRTLRLRLRRFHASVAPTFDRIAHFVSPNRVAS